MNISWLLSEQLSSDIDISELKEIGPTWGSCNLLEDYQIDNVVCNDIQKTRKYVSHNTQKNINFYIPKKDSIKLSNPENIKTFQGEFKDTNINFKDDIVAFNITAQLYDIILLVGFKFTKSKSTDKLEIHRQNAYLHNIQAIIKENSDKQFVLVNYKGKLSKDFEELENLMRDSMSNVIELAKEI